MTHRPIRPGIRTGREDEADEPARLLREAFSFWASGVAVAAVRDARGVQGLTVSAFSPVSLEPPMLLVCIAADAPLLTALRDARRFTVNLLRADQKRVASVFADRFVVTPAHFREGDDAVLEPALASFICSLAVEHEAGDHRIVIGRVERVEVGADAPPLLHYHHDYRTF